MKKIVIYLVIIAVIAGAGFFFYQKKVQAPSTTEKAIEVGTQAQSSVSGGVDKANPFNVDVNPYEGYKNPFE